MPTKKPAPSPAAKGSSAAKAGHLATKETAEASKTQKSGSGQPPKGGKK
jgi:hypothetical protein